MLMGMCYRYTKNEDDAAVLMNTGFLKIIGNLKKFDQAKPFEAWAKTVMLRSIISEYHADTKRRETFVAVSMDELRTSAHPVDFNEAENNLGIDEIMNEIKKLPEPGLTVFNLFVFEGLDHNQIGSELGMPANTSKWHLSKARKFLQNRISNLLSKVNLLLL